MNLIATIRKDSKDVHSIYEDNGEFYSKGEFGDNVHNSIISALQDLQGQDVHLDDLFWE